ncbi:MAG TPA: hypothetical protein VI316_02855 [Candidatus Dormibacteraeota bacterium]
MSSTGRLLSRAAVAGAIAVAAAAAAAALRARRTAPESLEEVDDEVRTAIGQGIATGGHGEPADEAVRWIPVNGHGTDRAGAIPIATLDDTPAAASA